MRLVSVIASLNAGGIGPVCRYAAAGMARLTGWHITLLSLHDPPAESFDPASGLRTLCLGWDAACPRLFLEWLSRNPQDLVITSDVSRLEPAFAFLPLGTSHIVHIHDSGRRYRAVAVRHSAHVNGIICVARHIERKLKLALARAHFQGLLRTVHNGADFPPLRPRGPHHGPLRLLFIGRLDPLKGVSDLPLLLARLKSMGVPVQLTVVGGASESLSRQFRRRDLLADIVWHGRVPHAQCYQIAAESDLLLVPSRKEAFGMATIEAMAMGCVPLAYAIPSGNTEIIQNGASGLLLPLGNVSACAEQITRLHFDRHRLTALSAAAIIRSRTAFNADVMSAALAAFIRDVIAHAESHPARREAGLPAQHSATVPRLARGYYRLPERLRAALRELIGARPKLCHWWLSR